MKVHTFNTMWSGYLFIVNCGDKDSTELINKFEFIDMHPDIVLSSLVDAEKNANAACFSVAEKRTGRLGVLLVMYNTMNSEKIAHEAVHIADWFFEHCGVNSESFSEGNEHYAYTVGWAAGCIANVLIKENNDSRRK